MSEEIVTLLPTESIALRMALAQWARGEEITPNIATMCVFALARLAGRIDPADYPGDLAAVPAGDPL
jgi:hypothetical protein